MKPFHLSKNHDSANVFNRENVIAENNMPIGGGDIPNISNINSGNPNIIRIEPIHIGGDNINQEDGEENPNLLNNLDME